MNYQHKFQQKVFIERVKMKLIPTIADMDRYFRLKPAWKNFEPGFVKDILKEKKQWKGLDAGCGKKSFLGAEYAHKEGRMVIGMDKNYKLVRENKDIERKVVCSLEN